MRKHSTLAVLACVVALSAASVRAPAAPRAGPTDADVPRAKALAEGLEALRVSDYDRAEARLGDVKGADEPEAKLALARVHLERGRYVQAERLARALASAGGSTKLRAVATCAEALSAQGKREEALAWLGGHRAETGPLSLRIALMLGEALASKGKRSEAEDLFHAIIDEYNDGKVDDKDAEGRALVGRAAYLLGSPKDANTAFAESEKIDKSRVETLLFRAELFLDRFDPGHAEEVVRDALAVAPKRADALVMMARVKLEQALDFASADKLARDALSVNPKHVGALAVRAGVALRDMDIAAAEALVTEGLATNPLDGELLGLRGAARFLDDDRKGFGVAKQRALSANPTSTRFYAIVAELAEWEHRYDDIVSLMKEAVALDPEDGKAWAALGLTLTRGGREDEGLSALQKAWSRDKFNVRVFNTLNLYEKSIAKDYDLVKSGIFHIRYGKKEREVLERYVPRLLNEAWGSMRERYGFTPSTPVAMELYDSREHFSVRTSGLPNIGIQGVCFGHVVAAVSPSAEPSNWGNVLWHELGHVFAIQLSKNHVPRWFTEGLSEYETLARRPEWAREHDAELFRALKEGRLPPAVDMNRAFSRASDIADMTIAYYASSQLVAWTVEHFGMARVVSALKLWGEGKKTPEVIRSAFGVTPEDYDAAFRTWALRKLSRYEAQYVFARKVRDLAEARHAVETKPKDAEALVDLALALVEARHHDEANQAIAQALAIDPSLADARFIAAKLAIGRKESDAAMGHLDAMAATGKGGYAVELARATLAEVKADHVAMRRHLEAAHRFDPSQAEPLRALLTLFDAEKRDAEALDVLRKLAALEQHDRKTWGALLERLVVAEKWEEAERVGESALFVDVFSDKVHAFFGRALGHRGAHARALEELDTALMLVRPSSVSGKELSRWHVDRAQSLAALGRKLEASEAARKALALDADNARAKSLAGP